MSLNSHPATLGASDTYHNTNSSVCQHGCTGHSSPTTEVPSSILEPVARTRAHTVDTTATSADTGEPAGRYVMISLADVEAVARSFGSYIDHACHLVQVYDSQSDRETVATARSRHKDSAAVYKGLYDSLFDRMGLAEFRWNMIQNEITEGIPDDLAKMEAVDERMKDKAVKVFLDEESGRTEEYIDRTQRGYTSQPFISEQPQPQHQTMYTVIGIGHAPGE